MHLPKQFIISIIIVLVLIGGVFIFLQSRTQAPADSDQQKSASTTQLAADASDWESFRHPTRSFSFRYPKGWSINSFTEADGSEVVVAQEQGGGQKSFQVTARDFDEDAPITKERILQDLPDMLIENPQTITVSGVQMLIFFSDEESLGKTREVWFSHSGYLYQASAKAELDELLSRVMAGWRFE